jgi:hypothetical protein
MKRYRNILAETTGSKESDSDSIVSQSKIMGKLAYFRKECKIKDFMN